jgi:hypothetical protein
VHIDRRGTDDVDRPDRGGEALEIHHRPASLAPGADRSGYPPAMRRRLVWTTAATATAGGRAATTTTS